MSAKRLYELSADHAVLALLFAAVAGLASGCGGGGGSNEAEVASSFPPTTPAPVPTPAPVTYSTVITWTPPTLNVDGSSVTDISGYRVIYGTDSGNLTGVAAVSGATATSAVVAGLSAGTYYFRVVVLTSGSDESLPSNAVSRVFP